jgi:hypothetical protein
MLIYIKFCSLMAVLERIVVKVFSRTKSDNKLERQKCKRVIEDDEYEKVCLKMDTVFSFYWNGSRDV